MKFDDLDTRMRLFETAHDHCVLPGIHIVARLDGRGFTKLTKETLELEAPFDVRFRDAMTATTEHLMECGFRIVFGYTQSDEISLLFHPEDAKYNRKLRKLNSVLAGEASAVFSMRMSSVGVFDCRICQLPCTKDVVDYFRWRTEDAHRNALNAHCYWKLRNDGSSVRSATSHLMGMSVAEKNELLFQRGTNFNDLPVWQKRGVGLMWEHYEKKGQNPQTGKETTALRRRVMQIPELPFGDELSMFIPPLLTTD
ncbi:MAG: guanylyltransferase [Phycisphaeraceae bacterium]|nr:hypothetical protein [Phycisphaerales bacterium]MCB9859649.1 guanylyltransferase [Phycisphaeraceae bacterium]